MTVETIILTDKTAYVVGNGPSLEGFDFTALKDRPWTGMNAAYRYWETTGIYPKYYTCLDLVVGLSHQDAICDLVKRSETLGIEKFLLRANLLERRPELAKHPRVDNYDTLQADLPERVTSLITTGSHTALWMASLGYEQIVLLGIDADYVEQIDQAVATGSDTLVIKSDGENPNYFFNDYQKPGDTYIRPNPVPAVHTGAWRRVAQYLAKQYPQSRLLNASPVSHLDCADFIDISAFFDGASHVTPLQAAFETPGRVAARTASDDIQSGYLNLAALVDALAPERYGTLMGDMTGLEDFTRLGWKSTAKSLPGPWDMFVPQTPDLTEISHVLEGAGIILHPVSTRKAALKAAHHLAALCDTVLLLEQTDETAFLRLMPGPAAHDPRALIAFQRERFLPADLHAALEAACGMPTPHKRLKRQMFRLWRQLRR